MLATATDGKGDRAVNLRILSVTCLFALTGALSACVPNQQPAERPKLGGRPTHIGIITKVSDGDTLSAAINGIPETILLTGIDCPDHDQPFAKEATQLAKKLALEKAVRITELGRDKFHRLLGEVVLPNGRMLNQELVREGVCWWYRKYAPKDTVLEGLEKYAREERKGLWADPKAVPPWEWRKRK
jgi:endonuclease YncB( thermonuclease family)